MKKLLFFAVATIMGCISVVGQWNSNNAENLLAYPDGGFYSSDMKATPDGRVWLAVHHSFSDGKSEHRGVTVALQLIDSLGNLCFDEPIEVSDYKSRSWTSCGDFLYVDRDGNAIVAIYDWRQGVDYYEGYTVYKISPEGEFLWGDDGITLDGENVYDLVASMSICQLADGSYVFAWMHNQKNDINHMSIDLQRISTNGEMLWNTEDVCLYDSEIPYSYPYLVDGGNNQVILLYAKGTAQDLYARKLDFDGTPVWSEDTRVYNGGWGSIPIWSIMDVKSAGDGGLLVSWNDDRYFTQIESAFMAYVKSNGEIGFSTDNGEKLGYAGWRSLDVKCIYDKNTDCFYAIWYECSSSQTWSRVVAQCVSKDGELLWGENALELKPMEQTNYGYLSLQSGADNEIAFFYMQNYTNNYGNVESFITTVNVNDTTLRRESEFTKGSRVSEKSGLVSTPMIDNKYWVVKWVDSGTFEGENNQERLLMQRINNDLSLGMPESDAVEVVRAENNAFVALATSIEGEAMFATNMSVPTQATLSIYNVNGTLVATPFNGELAAGKQYIEWNANVPAGVYVATLTTDREIFTTKILVK